MSNEHQMLINLNLIALTSLKTNIIMHVYESSSDIDS